MTLYKLTDEKDRTYGGCQWGEGVTHEADGKGDLCTSHWIHAYEHPMISVFMNPIHGNFDSSMHLWECEGEIGIRNGQEKCGCKRLTTKKKIPVPIITIETRVEIAIRCALAVYQEPSFVAWAKNWLTGSDRTVLTAEAAAEAAVEAAWATEAAARAAWAATSAAEAAARAAMAAIRAVEDLDLLSIILQVLKEG